MSCSIPECLITGAATTLAITLTDRADVYRLKPVGVGVGDRPKGRQKWPDDYALHLAAEPTRVTAARWRREEGTDGGQIRARGDWILRFRAATDVGAEDRVKVTTLSNRVFNIIGLLNGSDELIRIAEASEIT